MFCFRYGSPFHRFDVAGVVRVERTNMGVKVPCLNHLAIPLYEKPPDFLAAVMGDSSGSVSLTPFPASRTSCFLFARGSSKDLSPVSFTLAAAMALLTTPEMPTNLRVSLYYPPHSKIFSSLTDCPENLPASRRLACAAAHHRCQSNPCAERLTWCAPYMIVTTYVLTSHNLLAHVPKNALFSSAANVRMPRARAVLGLLRVSTHNSDDLPNLSRRTFHDGCSSNSI